MNPSPAHLDIWIVKFKLGKAEYGRPCIMLDLQPKEPYQIILLSTKNYARFPGDVFKLEVSHPDFKRTGLIADTYTLGHEVHYVSAAELISRKGKPTGELAQAFAEWF